MRRGTTLISKTKVSVSGGEPLSLTCTPIWYVRPLCSVVGDQENKPLVESSVAPVGLSRTSTKVNAWFGAFESVALTVPDTGVPGCTTIDESGCRCGGALLPCESGSRGSKPNSSSV